MGVERVLGGVETLKLPCSQGMKEGCRDCPIPATDYDSLVQRLLLSPRVHPQLHESRT